MARRNTVQQKVIAEQLHKMHGSHPTVDEVHRAISADYPSISKTTVYRTLARMAEDGQALKVSVAGGADHFDDTLHPHYHVVCTKCGRVDDVDVQLPQQPFDSIDASRASGYTITGYELLFQGICPACAQQERQA